METKKLDGMDIDMHEKLNDIVNKKRKVGEEPTTESKKSKKEAHKGSKDTTRKVEKARKGNPKTS